MIEIAEKDFEQEVLKSEIPVLVDFWAVWCRPCHVLSAIIEKVAVEYAGKVKFCKVNTEDNIVLSQQYGISSLPTLMLFKEGKLVNTSIGVKQEKAIKEMLDEVNKASS